VGVFAFALIFIIPTDLFINIFPSRDQRIAILLFPILLSVSTHLLNNGYLYSISTDSRAKSSFLERNKDQLILLIIGAAIGAFFAKLFK
jgi:hypothetical protein